MTAEDAAELTGFIEARLAEDEAAAKAASDEFGVSGHWYRPEDAGKADLGIAGAQWAHIARHDPARVLREVQSKRAIMAVHVHARRTYDKRDAPVGCALCHVGANGEDYNGGWCETVRALAAIWSDHPDYRDAWKPA